MTVTTLIKTCPICGALPDIDECGPPFDAGLGWYANCFRMTPYEHCIGVNADTKALVVKAWNIEAEARRNT